jgi:hypothetical protein
MNLDKLFECCKNRKDEKIKIVKKSNEYIITNELKNKMIFKPDNIIKTPRKNIIDEEIL